jgi:[FeFe] hydrogenase H-cluster maturation GTPase HydF
MMQTPRGNRVHIGLFGRTNVGKSTLLNRIAGQDVAIASPLPGTTTDVVEKGMELLPIGPVVFLDTAGLGDASELGEARMARTRLALPRCDVAVLVTEPDCWGDTEEEVVTRCREAKTPLCIVVNKCDLVQPTETFLARLRQSAAAVVASGESTNDLEREGFLKRFKEALLNILPDSVLQTPPLLGDLVPAGGLVMMVVPIDLQAPKGRLILPQVQAIRDALDSDASVFVVKERELAAALARLTQKPDLVVCDSQAVLKTIADTPRDVPCTTFSTLFARAKADLVMAARGAAKIDRLKSGSRLLIAEGCSHHALEDDIGRVKIPRWLRQYTGVELSIAHASGRDFPEDLSAFDLVIHCGACTFTRRQMLARSFEAAERGVAFTNYGVAISCLQGVIERVLEPFPAALAAYREARDLG